MVERVFHLIKVLYESPDLLTVIDDNVYRSVLLTIKS